MSFNKNSFSVPYPQNFNFQQNYEISFNKIIINNNNIILQCYVLVYHNNYMSSGAHDVINNTLVIFIVATELQECSYIAACTNYNNYYNYSQPLNYIKWL